MGEPVYRFLIPRAGGGVGIAETVATDGRLLCELHLDPFGMPAAALVPAQEDSVLVVAGGQVVLAPVRLVAPRRTITRCATFTGTVGAGDCKRVAIPEAATHEVALTGLTITGVSDYWGTGVETTITARNHAPGEDPLPEGSFEENVSIAAAGRFTDRTQIPEGRMIEPHYPYLHLSVAHAGGHADVQIQIDLEVRDAR